MKPTVQFRLPILIAAAAAVLLAGFASGLPGRKAEAAATSTVQLDADDDRDTSKYPKPDVTAMNKWFEMTKYRYDFEDNSVTLYLFLKAKTDSPGRPTFSSGVWVAEPIDEDGAKLGECMLSSVTPDREYQKGDIMKVSTPLATEGQMNSIKAVVVKRLVR